MKTLLLILFPLVTLAQLPNPDAYTWSQLTTGISYDRDGVECVYLNGSHYAYGGWSTGTTTFKKQFRSADAINFIATPDAPWLTAHTFATAQANNCLYKVLGDPFNATNDGHYDSTSWRTSDTNWVQLATNNGLYDHGPRWGGHMIYNTHNKVFYYFGGQVNLTAGGGVYNEVWKSTDSTRTFTRISTSTPFTGGLLLNSVRYFKNRIIKIGGATYDTDISLRTYPREIFTGKIVADTIQWTLAGYMPIKMKARHYQFFQEFDGLLWLGCGYNNYRGNNILDIWCSDDGINWVAQTPSAMAERHAQSAWVSPDGLHVMFGTTDAGGGTTTSDGWIMEKP
jgi:hypothetical protein